MYENIKTSLSHIRKEDICVELELGLVNEIIKETASQELECFDASNLRRELNNLMQFVNQIYAKHQDKFSSKMILAVMKEKKEQLDKANQQLQEVKTLDEQLAKQIAALVQEEKELSIQNQAYLQKLNQKDNLEKQIDAYKNCDEAVLNQTIKQLEGTLLKYNIQKDKLQRMNEQLTNDYQKIIKEVNEVKQNNQIMQENIKQQKARKESLIKDIEVQKKQKETINQDIVDLQQELNTIDKIPETLISKYETLKTTLHKKKMRLQNLLENDSQDNLQKQILSKLKKSSKLEKEIIDQGLEKLDQQADEVLKEYQKCQLLGLSIKEQMKKDY